MKKLIYAIGVSLFLAFMAFHVTVSLTNPYWGVSVEALAQGSTSWPDGTGCGSVDSTVIQCAEPGTSYGCCFRCDPLMIIFRSCVYTGSPTNYCSLSCGP